MTQRLLAKVEVTSWPNQITFTYEDGTIEKTEDDISTAAGRSIIACRIAKLVGPAAGTPAELFELLGGRHGMIEGTGAIWKAGVTQTSP